MSAKERPVSIESNYKPDLSVRQLIKFLKTQDPEKRVLLEVHYPDKFSPIWLAESVRSCNPWYICIKTQIVERYRPAKRKSR